ncbi:MAG: HDOD domain-containing protein [Limisphaerales bacterium]
MKRSIYVVDDQAGVLETMVLVLSCVDPEWVVRGFQDPLEALAAVKASPPDLVVSDQLMPGMQGSQLLEEVRAVSPTTVRVIMSGYVALNKLTLITSAHQYLAKPFDSAHLRQLIHRSFAARDRIADGGLQNVITGLKSIPSLRQVHQSLLSELEDNRHASTSIGQLVASDAGLSVKVLQLANSPLFGQGELIASPVDAVICLGTDLVAALVFSQTLFRHYDKLSHADIDVERIWNHCWEVAYLAQHICREKGLARKAGEEAFLAGLLHESGRLILSDNFPDQFHAACEAARQAKSPLAPRLRETFQASSLQLTAWLLELWGLPVNVINAIAALDKPEATANGEFSVAAALYLADRLTCRKSPPDDFVVEDLDQDYLKSIGCADDVAIWEELPLMEQPPGTQ